VCARVRDLEVPRPGDRKRMKAAIRLESLFDSVFEQKKEGVHDFVKACLKKRIESLEQCMQKKFRRKTMVWGGVCWA